MRWEQSLSEKEELKKLYNHFQSRCQPRQILSLSLVRAIYFRKQAADSPEPAAAVPGQVILTSSRPQSPARQAGPVKVD